MPGYHSPWLVMDMFEDLAIVEVTFLGTSEKKSQVKVELSFLTNKTRLLGENLLERSGEEILLCPKCQMPYLKEEVEYLKESYGKCLNCGEPVSSFI